jgi:nucleoside-diphosphate-sugar epimerase
MQNGARRLKDGSKILVAGGAGFIGQHLCLRLAREGYGVTCLDNFSTSNPNTKYLLESNGVNVKVGDVAAAEDGDFRSIFHLASPASPVHYKRLSLETMWANALGTKRLLDLAADTGASFVFASTSEIYGDPLVHPQNEDYFGNVNPVGERACYDESKRFAEALTAEYTRLNDLSARIVRIFNTYGPGMDLEDGRAVPTFVVSAILGNEIVVQGSGQQTRSFCYVDDLVEGLLTVSRNRNPGLEIYNLGNPEEIRIIDLAKTIVELVESHSEITFVAALPDDPGRRRPDISKVVRDFNWIPQIPLGVGLCRVIQDIRDRLMTLGSCSELG